MQRASTKLLLYIYYIVEPRKSSSSSCIVLTNNQYFKSVKMTKLIWDGLIDHIGILWLTGERVLYNFGSFCFAGVGHINKRLWLIYSENKLGYNNCQIFLASFIWYCFGSSLFVGLTCIWHNTDPSIWISDALEKISLQSQLNCII